MSPPDGRAAGAPQSKNVQILISSEAQTKSAARSAPEKSAKQLRRAKFLGTTLERASDEMLIEEELLIGGWTRRRKRSGDLEVQQQKGAGKKGERRRGPQPSVTPEFAVDRRVRIYEPRMAPRPQNAERHHHFEQKTILASRKGSVSVAVRRAAYGEGFNTPIVDANIRATNEAAYAEGSKSTDAERVVYVTATNGDTFEERMEFWRLANENAHFVRDHEISVTTRGAELEWDKVARDPTMPDVLREALAKARASEDGQATLVVNDAGVVKRWQKKRSAALPKALQGSLALETPHNSRVAYSIVGQFPHDMSVSGMKSSLDRLVEEFTRRRIPCQAVIHEPTRKNSKKNWHFHLIYYAGEAERLDSDRWSFERVNVRDKWGTMKWVPLKRMPRSEEVADRNWLPRLKARWGEIVNERAIEEGIATRFTNLTNAQRGLQKPQTRYTAGRMALHKQGYFTDSDIQLNISSWDEWEKRKKAQLRKAQAAQAVRHQYERLSGDTRLYDLPDAAQGEILSELDSAEKAMKQLDAGIDMMAWAAKLRGMAVSGPADTIAHYGDIEEQLGQKNPTDIRKSKRQVASEVRREAQAYLLEIQPQLDLIQHFERIGADTADQAVNILRKLLPTVERDIESAVVKADETARGLAKDGAIGGGPASAVNSAARADVVRRQLISAHLASGRAISM